MSQEPSSREEIHSEWPCRARRKIRSDKGGRHNMGEASHQVRILEDLNRRKIPHYAPPQGAAEASGNYILGNALKKRGAYPGIPDVQVFRPGIDGTHALFLELKSKGLDLDPHQRAWAQTLEAEGFRRAPRAP